MTSIALETIINAPIEICFDLSRSIELHQISTAATDERAIKGKLTGLCEIDDTVTWRAKHFGFYHQLTMEISKMEIPVYFEDRMRKGIFKSIRHEHFFSEAKGVTLMKDLFQYEVPAGLFGVAFDNLVLKRYMKKLLETRNITIRSYAEGNWKSVLPPGKYNS